MKLGDGTHPEAGAIQELGREPQHACWPRKSYTECVAGDVRIPERTGCWGLTWAEEGGGLK